MDISSYFEQRHVAFLDVLGFSAIIREAEVQPSTFQRFIGLKAVVEGHVNFDNFGITALEAHQLPRYIFISDSLIISTEGDEMGYKVLAVKCIQISLKLLEMGFLLRGAITRGPRERTS